MNRKTILIAAGVLILIVVVSVVLISSKKPATTTIDDGTNGSTSGNGGLTNVTPGSANGGFTVVDDPTQPFASISPRANEPIRSTPSGTGGTATNQFDDYNKAVALGQIPDKNGLYHQNVDPNYNPYKSADNALSSTDFLSKYYGSNTVASTNNGTDQFGQQVNSGSGALVVTPDDTSTVVVATNASLSGVISKVGTDNSAQAINAYYASLTSATSSFDLVNDLQKHYLDMINVNTVQELAVMKGQVETIKANIAKLSVPSKLVGMSQHYYIMYDTYSTLLDYTAALVQGNDLTEEEQTQFDTAYSDLSNQMQNIMSDLIVMRNILNQ